MKAKDRRTSYRIHYCREHGKFIGWKWGGHRKHCDVGEVSEEEYLKAKGLPPVEHAPAPAGSNGHEDLMSKVRHKLAGLGSAIQNLDVQIVDLAKEKQSLVDERDKILSDLDKIGK